MHPYAVDSEEHRTIILHLLAPAIVIAVIMLWLLGLLFDQWNVEPPLWVQALISGPSAVGVMSLLLTRIEARWWRNPLVRKLGIQTPDLAGTYNVVGKTSYKDGESPEWHGVMEICQTWSSISICLETAGSRSESTSASIHVGGNQERAKLTYEYQNNPKSHAAGTMLPHRGFSEFRVVSPGRLSGHYYTHPRYRSNYGDMELTKQPQFD